MNDEQIKSPMRIGMYGGAFDPPHTAHIALAQAAIKQLNLDVLHIIPTGFAWHKAQQMSSSSHRMAMAELAFGDIPKTNIDAREILRGGPTYTLDTLHELQVQYPGAQLYLVMGADQAAALPTWKHFDEIAKLAIICVAERADTSGLIPYASTLNSLQNSLQLRAIHIELPIMLQSATDVRNLVAMRKPYQHLLPPAVVAYIEEHWLYI
ncbi:MAG TPA: nicotinate (nicotinamide) nucleotide adenylyltransferase [Burkholderiaceae bacterium]|nr:nicotinate (nicotinamide) nucleotide adenylyltransferase [Burkholderiaceae bacterium]